MVRLGPFEVALVEAVEQAAFKEHVATDGTTYVEVEPGAEYFIGVRVVESRPYPLRLTIDVDGVSLGYEIFYEENEKIDESAAGWQVTDLYGLWVTKDGTSSATALQFHKVAVACGGPAIRYGVIRIELCQMKEDGKECFTVRDRIGEWKAAAVPNTSVDGKNVVNSVAGNTQYMCDGSTSGMRIKYKFVARLRSCELKYCTAQGLVVAGILPHARRGRDSGLTQTNMVQNLTPAMTNPQRFSLFHPALGISKSYELFDFTGEGDSDED